ncbi:MAG TPA: hypothetical protein VFO61_03570 [Alphaproteobacteria bacterium]|nr:hypothetical protein [Alphaproteobacteria bacterium]
MTDLLPRIEYENLEPGLKELFRPRVERLGYLGEFFRAMSACPETMKGFYAITESLKKELPDNFGQIVSVALSSRLGNRYEQYQNERLSLKLGLSKEWVRSALGPIDDPASVFTPEEKAVQAFAVAAGQSLGRGVDHEFKTLVERVGERKAAAVLWLVGRTITHALISNTLHLAPPVTSIFDQA